MPSRQIYRRSPLTEAVHEFYLDPSSVDWQEKHWDEITNLFRPILPITDHVQVNPSEARHDSPLATKFYAARRFSTTTKGLSLTVGESMIGLSIQPQSLPSGYPGWDHVHSMALGLLKLYGDLVKSDAVIQIIVRYINRIPVIPGDFRLSAFVSRDCSLIPTALYAETNPFRLELLQLISGNETEARSQAVQLTAGLNESGSHELMLRIDEAAFSAPNRRLKDVKGICSDLHNRALETFTSVFSEEQLQSFEPEENSSTVMQ